MAQMTVKEISNIIDAIHATSVIAMKQKNLVGYMSIFSDNLSYTQYNGRVINKDQLTKDQKRYFSRIESVESGYERIASSSEPNLFSETLIHRAVISIRVFFIFKKKWKVMRKGDYTWSLDNDEWKINNVQILEEKISQG